MRDVESQNKEHTNLTKNLLVFDPISLTSKFHLKHLLPDHESSITTSTIDITLARNRKHLGRRAQLPSPRTQIPQGARRIKRNKLAVLIEEYTIGSDLTDADLILLSI